MSVSWVQIHDRGVWEGGRVVGDAGSTPRASRGLVGVLEALWLRRAASKAAGVGFWGPSEALAPARGAALGAFLGAACWALVAALAWTLAR